jgi:hypothetical protein
MNTGPATGGELGSDLGPRPRVSGRAPVSYRLTLGLASLAGIFLWYWPVTRTFLSPITFLNTYIHEFCHAIAAWATGGTVSHILIEDNSAGETFIAGGNAWIVASAGYVGSAIVGAILLSLSHRERLMRLVLMAGSVLLLAGIIGFVRGHALGTTIGIISAAALFLAAWKLPSPAVVFTGQFLAIQQCAASFQAFYWLFVATNIGDKANDAKAMADMTHLPPVFWAGVWSLFSAALIFFSLRGAWRATGRQQARRKSASSTETIV